jgi:hypothetical protein
MVDDEISFNSRIVYVFKPFLCSPYFFIKMNILLAFQIIDFLLEL